MREPKSHSRSGCKRLAKMVNVLSELKGHVHRLEKQHRREQNSLLAYCDVDQPTDSHLDPRKQDTLLPPSKSRGPKLANLASYPVFTYKDRVLSSNKIEVDQRRSMMRCMPKQTYSSARLQKMSVNVSKQRKSLKVF